MTFSTEDDEEPLTESVTRFWKTDTSGTKKEDEISLFKNYQRAVEIRFLTKPGRYGFSVQQFK